MLSGVHAEQVKHWCWQNVCSWQHLWNMSPSIMILFHQRVNLKVNVSKTSDKMATLAFSLQAPTLIFQRPPLQKPLAGQTGCTVFISFILIQQRWGKLWQHLKGRGPETAYNRVEVKLKPSVKFTLIHHSSAAWERQTWPLHSNISTFTNVRRL